MNPKGARATIRPNGTIDGKGRASVGLGREEIPVVPRFRRERLFRQHDPNRFPSAIPRRRRRHGKGRVVSQQRHQAGDILGLPRVQIALQERLCRGIRGRARCPLMLVEMVVFCQRGPPTTTSTWLPRGERRRVCPMCGIGFDTTTATRTERARCVGPASARHSSRAGKLTILHRPSRLLRRHRVYDHVGVEQAGQGAILEAQGERIEDPRLQRVPQHHPCED